MNTTDSNTPKQVVASDANQAREFGTSLLERAYPVFKRDEAIEKWIEEKNKQSTMNDNR